MLYRKLLYTPIGLASSYETNPLCPPGELDGDLLGDGDAIFGFLGK